MATDQGTDASLFQPTPSMFAYLGNCPRHVLWPPEPRFWLLLPWQSLQWVSWGILNFLCIPLIGIICYWWFHWIAQLLWDHKKCEVSIYLCGSCLQCCSIFLLPFLLVLWILFLRLMAAIFGRSSAIYHPLLNNYPYDLICVHVRHP